MASPTPTLNCGQCGYDNEPERVYCHNCGTKLDRSVLPKESERKVETLGQTRRRVKKMTNPGAGGGRHIGTFFKVICWAAVTAALVLIFAPPDDLPAVKRDPAEMPRLINSELLEALNSPQPRQLVFSEADVNSHLRALKGKAGSWMPGLEFKRAFVDFDPGVAKSAFEQTFFGWPLYWRANYHLFVVDGKLRTRQTGGYFGRLAIHPMIMEYAQVAFHPVLAALKKEREQMERMQSVTIQKDRIILVTKPAGRP